MGRAWRLQYKSSVPDVTFFGNKRCCDWDTYFCPFFPHVEMCFTHNPEAQSSRSPTKPSLPGMAFFMRMKPRMYMRGSADHFAEVWRCSEVRSPRMKPLRSWVISLKPADCRVGLAKRPVTWKVMTDFCRALRMSSASLKKGSLSSRRGRAEPTAEPSMG